MLLIREFTRSAAEGSSVEESGRCPRRTAASRNFGRRIPLRGLAQMLTPRSRLATLDGGLCGCELLTLRPRLLTLSRRFACVTPLEYALAKKCACKCFRMHSYKIIGLKVSWNDILTKNTGGGTPVRFFKVNVRLVRGLHNVQKTPAR